jgi:hypothetical protein
MTHSPIMRLWLQDGLRAAVAVAGRGEGDADGQLMVVCLGLRRRAIGAAARGRTMDASLAFLAAFVIAVAFIIVSYWFPTLWTKRFKIVDAEKKAEVEDSYRKTVAQILGGAAITLAFAWTWFKDNQTLDLSRIQTSNQQFTDAATLIANADADARAAGIYSMAELVSANPDYLTPVINVLRMVIKTHQPKPAAAGASPPKVTDDVFAAIHVLGRVSTGQPPLDMEDLYLVGGDFTRAKGFRGAKFYSAYLYQTNFSSADLTGALFDGAQMADWQSVGSALWSDAFIAQWWGKMAWQRVQYVALFDWATLTNASFQGTSVAGASFEHADLAGAIFIKTDLSRADFSLARNLDQAVFQNDCYGGPGTPFGLSPTVLKTLRTPC